MGKHGPPPKPLPLRILHGDPNKARTDLAEPQAAPLTDGAPPYWMDTRARDVWEAVIAELDGMGVLRQVDLYIVAAFVSAFRTYEEAAQVVAGSGTLVEGANGNLVRNPAVAVQRDAMNMIRLMGRELGMSPAARTMMATRPQADDASTVAARYLTGS
jgi:P27 family predicted phage terminase small subunit